MDTVGKVKIVFFKILNKFNYSYFDIKGWFIKKQFSRCGDNVKFWGCVAVKNPHFISVGENVSFNDGVYLNGLGGVIIGNNVALSAGCMLVSTGLDASSLVTGGRCHLSKPIIVGDNVQIGAGSIVLAGLTVGSNVIIGAGSIVTKNVPSNSIYAGNPAKLIRRIN
ncbi:acyltransferase [Vibrio fluvialis]|uniref:acyltransferase n=1 Tax=Vibrio fluvialis TaxID=676 RepID=UPI001C9C4998|nr:acyltransferase [Vibrio fluvialis]MBY7950044.1 acyltransferase [Vibrio fluvialis]MBY8001394.1 acyltransferase [Vibrio fluvialis]MBY8014367.1 acyltransferase [Vibrio fluvialis]MBY8018312.1 acyltransferase [Vibrio fluvialis]MCE7584526.1 acyltransferase [Vibrio fluvialis]